MLTCVLSQFLMHLRSTNCCDASANRNKRSADDQAQSADKLYGSAEYQDLSTSCCDASAERLACLSENRCESLYCAIAITLELWYLATVYSLHKLYYSCTFRLRAISLSKSRNSITPSPLAKESRQELLPLRVRSAERCILLTVLTKKGRM